MLTLPNGSSYKLLFVDTNILSNICKNKNNEKKNFLERFICNHYAPCFSFQSVLEVYNSSLNGREELYQAFIETFSVIPNLLLLPYREITNQEIEQFIQNETQINLYKCMNAFSIAGQNKSYHFDFWIREMIDKLKYTIENEEKEIEETAREWYSERVLAKQRHNVVLYPKFEEEFFRNFFYVERPEMLGGKYNTNDFIAIKMMSITKYDRIYGCSRSPIGKNDVNDVFISAYIPYMDAIIMENHQVDLVRQSVSKLKVLQQIERFTFADIRLTQ